MRVALCQLPISSAPAVNLGRVRAAVADAASQGAGLAVFPEATLARFGSNLRVAAEPLDGPFCRGLSGIARDAGVAVAAGVFEPAPGGRVYNTVVAYDADGGLVAAYRKIHLYDALGQRESELVAAGDEPVLCDLAGLQIGILTCYDIRFPEHARALAAGGAQLIVVPAAWAAGLSSSLICLVLRRPGSAAACSWTRWARSGSTSDRAAASRSVTSTPR